MGKLAGKKTRKPKKKTSGKKADAGGSGDDAGSGSEDEGERQQPSSPRIALMSEEDGEVSRKFKQVLVQLFSRFDVDGDKLLNEEELLAFSRAANEDEREFDKVELQELRDYFDWKDGPNGGGLTLRGFMQMYHTQTQSREDDTWQDLYTLGYTGQLEIRVPAALRAEGELRAKLEELIRLGEANDLDGFVAGFAAPDVDEEDRAAFLASLKEGDGGGDGQLPALLAELRCCVTGDRVFKVQGNQEKGPVTFHFRSPRPGMEEFGREVEFIKVDGTWYPEG